MPLHLRRLLLVFVVLLTLFIVAKKVLTPKSFGQFGHYRGLALDEIKAHDAKYMGEKSCAECHEDFMDLKTGDMHTGLSCETCHGPGWKHIEDPAPGQLTIPEGRAFCLVCHSKNPARPADQILQIYSDEHNTESNCIECHNPHAPWN